MRSFSFFCSRSVLAWYVATALVSFWILPVMDRWYSLKSLACCRMLLRYSWEHVVSKSLEETRPSTKHDCYSHHRWHHKCLLPDVSACVCALAQSSAASPVSLWCGLLAKTASCFACRPWRQELSLELCRDACIPPPLAVTVRQILLINASFDWALIVMFKVKP